MKTKYLVLIGLFLVLAVVLGGCATGLTASSWPGITADAHQCLHCRWALRVCCKPADRRGSLAFSGQGCHRNPLLCHADVDSGRAIDRRQFRP